VVPASRRYDGAEISLAKRAEGRWFGKVTYTYSKLRGNYSGLTATDVSDSIGRNGANTDRAFDEPYMQFDSHGNVIDGPLATDRPNTFKGFGFYRAKWFGMSTIFGVTELLYQGTPISTCLPVIGTSSACQWAEGRGNFVDFVRNPDGSISKTGVEEGKRGPWYIQTDFTVRHEIITSKEHENRRLSIEANIGNLFNRRAATSWYEFAIPASLINPARTPRLSGDLGVDFGKVMNGYNYVDALNATGAFAGNTSSGTKIQAPLTLASRYGMANGWQGARNIRLTLRFSF
jgi:hypothetical protein